MEGRGKGEIMEQSRGEGLQPTGKFSSSESDASGCSRSKKDEVYQAVLRAALELDSKRGHLKWTISDLSRKSETTRSLIYYYFGPNKEAILIEAVRLIGEELFGLSRSRLAMWRSGKIAESIWASRMMLEQQPMLHAFFIHHRTLDTFVGVQIREFEKKHIQKVKYFFPNLSDQERKIITGLMTGLVFTQDLDQESLRVAVGKCIGPLIEKQASQKNPNSITKEQ